MYRDSKLGLCLDLTSEHGNVFWVWGHARNLDKQLGRDPALYHQHLKLASEYSMQLGLGRGGYALAIGVFEHTYPMVTLLNKEEALSGGVLEGSVSEGT